MSRKRSGNIIKYHRSLNINIGLVIFIFIFIYLVFNVYTFMTSKYVSYVEVDEGSLMMTTSYRALALRDEQVIYSPAAGRINYYLKENSKASSGSLICSIDEKGAVSKKISETANKKNHLDDETFKELIADIRNFCDDYRDSYFFETATFSEDLNASIYEAANLSALKEMNDLTGENSDDSSFHKIYTQKPGIISYYEDAYENINIDNFSSGMFDESNYNKTNLKLKDAVSEGKMLYKIVSSEKWNLVIPIDNETADFLSEQTVLRIRFKKDDSYAWAYSEITEKGGDKYLILSLNNSLIRFLSDRFLDVDLMMENTTGLKIANSSITSKEFFAVPKKYFTYGGDSNSLGLMYTVYDDDGNASDRFVATSIYGKNIEDDEDESTYDDEEIVYYVYDSAFEKGLKIKNTTDPADSFTLSKTVNIDGVYNVNKGYTIFRKIEIIYSNEEYSIIKKNTNYGISIYDHIVLDASLVTEGEVI